jgi:5-methyltetrahydrofolate--homocysteine methyltransferase
VAASAEVVERLYRALAVHDPAAAIAAIEAAKVGGVPHGMLFESVFVPAMAMLGEKWAAGELDELAFTEAAVAAEQVTSFVVPPATSPDRGITVVVGCIEGDRHDLRKNIFAAAFKTAGYRVLDLGVNTSPAEFLSGVDETGARIVLAFAEMVGTASGVKRVREMLDAGGRSDVVLLVVGGPFEAEPDVARLLGANGVANSAQSVLRIVDRVAAEKLGSAT